MVGVASIDPKIFRAVIFLVSVEMVDHFAVGEFPSKHPFSDNAMFAAVFAVNPNMDIAMLINVASALPDRIICSALFASAVLCHVASAA